MARLIIIGVLVLFVSGCAGGHHQKRQLQGQNGQYVPVGGNGYLNTTTGQIERRYGNQLFSPSGQANNVIGGRVYDQPRRY